MCRLDDLARHRHAATDRAVAAWRDSGSVARDSGRVASRYAWSAMENDDVWLVVPLYNEARVIGDVVRAARTRFPHVVCVDDGSTDRSAEEAARAGAVVVRHPVNLGQGAALQTGVEYALTVPTMRWVVTFDADGQHQVDDVVDMLDKARAESLEVVFGSRFLDDRTNAGVLKKLVLRAAVGYTNLTTHTKLTDAHNGLRLISRDVAQRLDISQNRMAHASELVQQIGALDVRYGESPVHILYTDYSKAKGQSLWNAVNILAELILR